MDKQLPINKTVQIIFLLVVIIGVGVSMLFLMAQEIRTLHQQSTQLPGTTITQTDCSQARIYISLNEAVKDPRAVCHLNVSSQDISSLPDEIGQMVNLETLILANTNLNELPTVLFALPNIKVVDVRNTNLNQGQIEELRQRLPDTEIRSGLLTEVAD